MLLDSDRLCLCFETLVVRLVMIVFQQEPGRDLAKVDTNHLIIREEHVESAV